MTDEIRGRSGARGAHRSRRRERGQAIADAALVLPIMVILALGVGDLARAFAAGLVVESSAQRAAQTAAGEYLVRAPASVTDDPGAPAEFYAGLADVAARAVCAETKSLPATDASDAGTCATWPKIRVCVHDATGGGGMCGDPIAGFASDVPGECPELGRPWDSSPDAASLPARVVEVRVCERFELLHGLPLLPRALYLEQTRLVPVAAD